jgi:large subunit ribosomal protein L21
MKYAVIQIAGKQLKVAEGDTIKVNKMDSYEPVILAYCDESLELGNPILSGITISVTPQAESTQKTTVSRYKSKSRYRKSKGHKQPLVTLKVDSITKGSKTKVAEKEESTAKAEKAPKTTKASTSTKKEEKAE